MDQLTCENLVSYYILRVTLKFHLIEISYVSFYVKKLILC